MTPADRTNLELLREAGGQARKVVDELRRQRGDLRSAKSTTIAAETLIAGERVIGVAFESAERMLKDIDDAISAESQNSNQETAS